MTEQYWNYDGKNWYWTDKPIRGRNYFYDYTWYGIKTYIQIVPKYRNHKIGSDNNGNLD